MKGEIKENNNIICESGIIDEYNENTQICILLDLQKFDVFISAAYLNYILDIIKKI